MNPVNIRLLASELNLSIGTVSKALKDSYEISGETKKRVLALAKKLNYTPNPYASSLRRKKSNTIAVVVPEVADSFFSLAIKGIEEIAQAKGYHVLIYLTYESPEKEKKILEDCKNGRVDGVLLSVSAETCSATSIEELHAAEVPLVFFDRALEGLKTAKVRTNDFECGYMATQHLIEQECRRIAFLSISQQLDINLKRLHGYQAALAASQNTNQNSLVIPCTNNDEENYVILSELMKGPQKPDGVIASVEKLITPFYRVCNDLNIAMPAEVKLIGFSNLPTAEILRPALTTITQPAFTMGKVAATILFNVLGKQNYRLQEEDIVVPSELHLRVSTANE
ncbi:MAG TPA: LacI family DNA-binding transcriptional regulator [Flavisolibacter sp.]|jgi:LacI family transcriptional regulator|nr:LacI family DNA-binding transcriptional regulator [Flavisolibacter sp.]